MTSGGGATAVAAGGGCGGGMIDPSNLHLKKELTQIRKAARVLRDPGTSSSSWRSPINSARSLTKHHYVHHRNNSGAIEGNQQFMHLQNSVSVSNGVTVSDSKCNVDVNVNVKEKRVFLCNWRSQKSESEMSKQIRDDDGDNVGVNCEDEDSFTTSVLDVDSLSDARNGGGNDSKSDNYLSEKYGSAIFKCKDTDFTPSIMRTIKKKSKRGSYGSSAVLRHHHNEKCEKRMILSRSTKNVVDLVSLVDQSDDTEDYPNSEDLRRASAISPLLARFKNKGWAHSSTLSTSSQNKYGIRNPSTVESWDATTGSFNDADDEVDDNLDLPGRQGCGIPCYWSRRSTPKSRIGYESCYSPSLSDTLRRKGSSIFCGTHQRTRRHQGSNKRRPSTRVAAGQSLVPLLTSNSDDELSTNFGELDLEALSRLDGRRWSSSCRSQEGLEIVVHDEGSPENVRSLSHKYRPMFFDELVGQNIVVQSLKNAISRGRIAPVYLFQGPRGTGKTSTARIFAAALNCLATEDNNKPCGVCRECSDFISGKSGYIREVDGSNKKGIEKIKNLLKSLLEVRPSAQYKVLVVDECHLLPSKMWLTFLRLLEKPMPNVVFVLITTDIDNVPRAILSRCQKHVFNKIGNGEIVLRLRKIAGDENLDIESEALEMISLNADGSLRDAETMMDQLSLFGKRITVSLVNELIGVVSDEKLLELLELAMSSNATETVIRARELMYSGVDPIVLMSQMATLIVDIIAGTYQTVDGKHESFFGGGNLSERELERLKHALTLLSEAEKHLRHSSERSTWFTATLLQLGSNPSPDRTHSGSSRRQSSKATEDDRASMLLEVNNASKKRTDSQLLPEKSGSPKSFPRFSKDNPVSLNEVARFNSNPSQDEDKSGRTALRCVNSKMLNNIWVQCVEKCHSKTLRQLLHSHGKLVSISEVKGGFVAHIGFVDKNIKTRAEGFLSSITNSFEIVLRHNVEIKMILLPDSSTQKQTDKSSRSNIAVANSEAHQIESNTSSSKDGKSEIPVKRIESIIHEQRLETAWLQAMDRGTPRSMSRLKPVRNQVLPQDGTYPPNEFEPLDSVDGPLQHWEDELNREIKALKINDRMASQKDQIVAKRIEHYPISPSLLHNSSFVSNFSKDNNMGYESGSGAAGCSGMFCWNNSRPPRSRKPQAKQGTPLHSHKNGRFSWFGECAKSRRGNRYNR